MSKIKNIVIPASLVVGQKVFSAKKFIEEKEHIKLFSGNEMSLKSVVQYDGMNVTDVSNFNGLYTIEIDCEIMLFSKIDCSIEESQWQPYEREIE